MKAIFKTFDTEKDYIDSYTNSWRTKLFPDIVTTHIKYGLEMYLLNTFQINITISNTITEEELIDITSSLLKIFPANDKTANTKFYKLITQCQFKSNSDSFFISDYAIMEYNNYIIVWHIDIYNQMGISINNIFRKEDFELLKPLNKKIKVKVA